MKHLKAILGAGLGLLSIHCSSPAVSEAEGATSAAMSSSIASKYGVTTFGGAGDEQAVACGGRTSTITKWYVASSQRYGCHVHLQVTAKNGKCVVVSTEDAGPASWVESDAGRPVLDSSPAVADYLFGESGLGWSDLKGGQYDVTVTKTSAALGPCDGTSTSTGDGDTSTSTGDDTSTDTSSDSSSDDGSGSDDSGGTGIACGSDGQCNPGNNGSGLICVGGQCVPGCHHDYQCPGNEICSGGQCQ